MVDKGSSKVDLEKEDNNKGNNKVDSKDSSKVDLAKEDTKGNKKEDKAKEDNKVDKAKEEKNKKPGGRGMLAITT